MAALLHGFLSFDAGVHVAGVILNRVGSPRHEEVVRAAAQAVGLPVYGVLRRDDALSVPSRHLGLILAAERSPEAREAVSAMTALAAAAIDLTGCRRGPQQCLPQPWSASTAVGEPVAGEPVVVKLPPGARFTFGYPEHAELLAAAGARVVDFDPLNESLPTETAALVLGGGFPKSTLRS